MIKVIILIASIVLVLTVLWFTTFIIRISGVSMFPTYQDNEIVFGTRLFFKSKIKIGDVLVFRAPYDKDRLLIKRVANIEIVDTATGKCYYTFFMQGDNTSNSYDSRNFGYIGSSLICAKVLKPRSKRGE